MYGLNRISARPTWFPLNEEKKEPNNYRFIYIAHGDITIYFMHRPCSQEQLDGAEYLLFKIERDKRGY